MPLFGWDASDFDWGRGPMDLGAAVRDGITFFTHKATEGTRTRHVHYGEALRRARAAGVEFLGAYLVVRTPGNGGHGTVADQVAYFLAYLDQQTPWWRSTGEFFLQVDLEHWGYDDVAPHHGAQACDLLRAQTGKWVVHYAPRWAYGDSIGGDEPLWASAYGTNPAVPYRQAYPGDSSSGWAPYSGRTPTILQYGSRATIGSQPGCDANAFRGSLDQLRALITGGNDDMSTAAENILRAWAAGMQRGDGGENVEPVKWRVRDEKWQAGVDEALTGLAAAVGAGIQVAGQPTQEQVDAAMLKALRDPQVLKGIGDAVAAHLHVT